MTLPEVLRDPPARAAVLARIFRDAEIAVRFDAIERCWLSRRPIDPDGTVHVTIGKTELCLARCIYICTFGEEPPAGYAVTTRCRRPTCANPYHVQLLPKAALFGRRRTREAA